MDSDVGVAVVGYGYWGTNYVRLLSRMPGVFVAAVCDQSPERISAVKEPIPEACLTTDLDEVLRLQNVRAVVVATQASTHYDVVRKCLMAGKHVLVEKPIATTTADSKALTALAQINGLVLMVGHTFLFNSGVRLLKERMSSPQFGRLYYLYAQRTNMGPIRQDVDAIWDLASHDISIFNYLLDQPPSWVSAVGAQPVGGDQADVGFMTLGYRHGVVGHIHVSWADPQKVRSVVAVGSQQRIVFDDLHALEPVRIFEKGVIRSDEPGAFPFILRNGDIVSPPVAPSEPLRNQCDHFLDCIVRGVPTLSGGSQGSDVVRVLEAIDLSVSRNGVPVTIEEDSVHVIDSLVRDIDHIAVR